MQKYHDTRIADLLPRINSDILIPSIQRPYVWEPDQIVKLFDSLMRGYPINTFLFWELRPEHFGDWDIYRFVTDFRHGDIHNDIASVDSAAPVTLVLDGQQRLTSLLIGLRGSYTVRNGVRGRAAAWVKKLLFLNLVQSPDVDGDDDDGFKVRELHYGLKFFAEERPPKNDRDAVWFKVQDVLSIVDRDQLGAAIDRLLALNPDLAPEYQRSLRNNLIRLWDVVHVEKVIAYYLEREQSYDKVLDIFIRANDGGTKLSPSDLLMSMVTLRWDQFNARSETEEITYAMRSALACESGFERDYLLRAGLFFNDLDFAFRLRNFTPRNIAVIESRWGAVKRALLLSADLFKECGIAGGALTAPNAVMLIACYVFKLHHGKTEVEWRVPRDDRDRIRRWITCVLFHGVLGGAANVTMEFYRRLLNEQMKVSSVFPVVELTERMAIRGRNMKFDDEAVGRFVAQESKSRLFIACLQLLYARQDWAVKNWQVVRVIPSQRLLEDRLRLHGVTGQDVAWYRSWENSLANNMVLSDTEALEYYGIELEDWIATRSVDFLRVHHLPIDRHLYEERNFREFIQARRSLLTRYLHGVLQDRVGERSGEKAA